MDKKKADEQLIEYFREFLPQYKADFFQRQREKDKVIVWLTALSTGAIALILTQSKNLAISDPKFLKVSMVLFVLSILSGAIFRSLIYILEGIQSGVMLRFESFCHGYMSEVNGPMEIDETWTIEHIAKSLKEDLGIDYDHWLEKDYLDRDFWVELYDGWAKLWTKHETDGLKTIGRAYASVMNKLPEETEDMFLPKEAETTVNKTYTVLAIVCNWSYQIILLSFCAALISIVSGYVLS